MQKTWWVVNGERCDVASSYSGARHSWPANCTAVCCITALHCCCTMDQQCSVIQMLNGLVCATIEHRVFTCMIVEHLSLSIKSCVGQCRVDCKALVGCTTGVAGWVEGRAGPLLLWAVTCFDLNSHHQTFSQVITTSCTDPPPVGTQELVRAGRRGLPSIFQLRLPASPPPGCHTKKDQAFYVKRQKSLSFEIFGFRPLCQWFLLRILVQHKNGDGSAGKQTQVSLT